MTIRLKNKKSLKIYLKENQDKTLIVYTIENYKTRIYILNDSKLTYADPIHNVEEPLFLKGYEYSHGMMGARNICYSNIVGWDFFVVEE